MGQTAMTQNQSDFILLDHTADLGMEVYGTSLSELFEKAALALLQIMLGDKACIAPYGTRTISISADDTADLMVRWLGEILYLLDGEGRIVTGSTFNESSPNVLLPPWKRGISTRSTTIYTAK